MSVRATVSDFGVKLLRGLTDCSFAKRFIILGSIAITMALPRVAHGAFLSSLRYSSYAVSGSEVTIKTNGTGALRITVVYPDVARIWVAPNGTFSKDPSLFYDNFYQGTFDFGKSSLQVESWSAEGGTNVFYFFNPAVCGTRARPQSS